MSDTAMIMPSQGLEGMERFLESCQKSFSAVEPPNTLGPQLYNIQDIPGKGRGIVASINIAKGQRILCEQPIFTCSLLWTSWKDFESCLANIISSLPPTKRDLFFSHHNADPGSEYPLVARFRTNCLPCGDDAEAAIYATLCLLNHSCRANTHTNWNAEARLTTIHAIRDIKAGEEILVNYVSSWTKAVREKKLKRGFGITCNCELCSLPLSDIQQSDARRTTVQRLFDNVGDMQRILQQPEICLAECGQLIRLVEEEYAGWSEYLSLKAGVYDAAMQICSVHGDVASACLLQKESYETRVICEGSDSPCMRQVKGAIEYEHQETPLDTPRSFTKWYTKRGDEPRLLKFMMLGDV